MLKKVNRTCVHIDNSSVGNDPILSYALQTVAFGINCAPNIAISTLLQLAHCSGSEYLLASNIPRNSMYVVDVLVGAHDLETTILAQDQIINFLSTAKFELRKWTSNDKSVVPSSPTDYLDNAHVLFFIEASSSNQLGI